MNYLAIDIGGTYIKYGLIDHSGNIINFNRLPTPQNLDDFLITVFELIESVKSEIKGIGISLPGKIDTENGIVYFGGALRFLHELPLKSKIEKKFGIRCELANDGKAAALAELWLGNLKDVTNGAAIILGTGVGGGLIINGELYQGSHFQAGELSFIISNRILNNHKDMTGFSHSAVQFIKSASHILSLEDETDGKKVFEAIYSGENFELMKLFEQYCERIANLIINLQAVLDISTVVIGGGISQQNILIENIKKQYQILRYRLGIFETMLAKIEILPCEFRSEANLLGALYQFLLNIDKQ
ncbi:ROK family protein [Marinilactibacillus psychrotolerans]|uniref:ROK family protein n=1 Tax=Marinilactibacillus psychrotolerans TaxID=191770 RepID=UPI0039AF2F8F